MKRRKAEALAHKITKDLFDLGSMAGWPMVEVVCRCEQFPSIECERRDTRHMSMHAFQTWLAAQIQAHTKHGVGEP